MKTYNIYSVNKNIGPTNFWENHQTKSPRRLWIENPQQIFENKTHDTQNFIDNLHTSYLILEAEEKYKKLGQISMYPEVWQLVTEILGWYLEKFLKQKKQLKKKKGGIV